MSRGAAADWLLLRAFIAFRIETPSGNIFPRANLIKARRTGLLNEQTVTAPQHAATTARCSDGRRGTSSWWREVSKCNFMPQFFSFHSCRRALRQLAPHHQISSSGRASDLPDLFPLVPHLLTGK